MDYYTPKWEKFSTLGEIGEKSPFGKKLQASGLSTRPTFQAKSSAERLEKKKSRLMLHN